MLIYICSLDSINKNPSKKSFRSFLAHTSFDMTLHKSIFNNILTAMMNLRDKTLVPFAALFLDALNIFKYLQSTLNWILKGALYIEICLALTDTCYVTISRNIFSWIWDPSSRLVGVIVWQCWDLIFTYLNQFYQCEVSPFLLKQKWKCCTTREESSKERSYERDYQTFINLLYRFSILKRFQISRSAVNSYIFINYRIRFSKVTLTLLLDRTTFCDTFKGV